MFFFQVLGWVRNALLFERVCPDVTCVAGINGEWEGDVKKERGGGKERLVEEPG